MPANAQSTLRRENARAVHAALRCLVITANSGFAYMANDKFRHMVNDKFQTLSRYGKLPACCD